MFRNPYDTDCITWSPQGRIFQIEYAMEAVKQGTAVVALRGKKHAVLCAFRRRQSELASYQQKIFRIGDHIGVAISGLTADARMLCSFMRDECLSHKFTYDTPMSVGRLVSKIGVESQEKTQVASKRPSGVGLLVAGYDENGPHIYETCPSGNIFEYYAMAIGGRSQSARTYLENNYEGFDNIEDQKELLMHGLKALAKTLQDDATLTTENCSIAIVGEEQPFKELSTEELQGLISDLDQTKPEATGAAPMDTSE
ncbi:Proteasome subunit alpha 1 [Perkinsus olseni]|uniref:Proteasome subunit alpha 1 n=1 Tax=Perkinsus olseni TaxID=32597 RepID=A0A7J6M094_PEROL|nr:Proteasome subunit alpha 1 [Perkinsus olseni]KAF4672776.1 Proteasome subunit alpha 1 [Perkinsus olseni]